MKKATTVILISALISACASTPPPKQRPSVNTPSETSMISPTKPSGAKEKYSTTDISDSYFGVTGSTGGMAVGAMFGLIGAMASVAYRTSENHSRAAPLAKLTSMDLSEPLKDDFENQEPNGYVITPSANITFKDKTSYSLSCAISAKHQKNYWEARYLVEIEGQFNSMSNSDTSLAESKITDCIHKAAGLFRDHVDRRISNFQERTITDTRPNGKGKSSYKRQVAVDLLPDRIIINDSLGLSEVRPDHVTVQ